MRHSSSILALSLLVATAACAPDQALAPEDPGARPAPFLAPVPSASVYKATVFPLDGWFEDVNDKNLIVGMGNGRAIALPWGGTIYTMSSGPGQIAKALAVNTHGVIVGAVSPNCCAWVDLFPAFWPSYLAGPKILPDTGEAMDVNDQNQAVGYIMRRGLTQAIVWDLKAGSVFALPALPRGRFSTARAINNDQLILGSSDNGRGATVTVLWRRNGAGWSVQAVTGGIVGLDLDSSIGIVGQTANVASFGTPNHAGTFNVLGNSDAEAVSPNGVLAVGTDGGAATGWPVSSVAFVADRAGNTTYLPWPVSGVWRNGFGMGVTDCGLVVGTAWPLTSNWQPYTAQPIVWDPGC